MSNLNLANQCGTLLLTFTLFLCSNPTYSINKCTVNGQVTYTDLLCPDPTQSTPFTQQVVPPEDPAAAKKQHRANQKKLHKITQQKIKEERQYQREMQAMARHIRKEEDQKYKCKELDLKRKSARRQQSDSHLSGNSSAIEKARLQAKQAENRYVHYCKS